MFLSDLWVLSVCKTIGLVFTMLGFFLSRVWFFLPHTCDTWCCFVSLIFISYGHTDSRQQCCHANQPSVNSNACLQIALSKGAQTLERKAKSHVWGFSVLFLSCLFFHFQAVIGMLMLVQRDWANRLVGRGAAFQGCVCSLEPSAILKIKAKERSLG